MMLKQASCIFQTFLVGVICFSTIPLAAQTLAFPGAEGYGKYTTGGRGYLR